MIRTPLHLRVRQALECYSDRTVVESASAGWKMSGDGLLAGASHLLQVLRPHTGRPVVAYMSKSPTFYAFLACSFVNRLRFCPLDTANPIARLIDVTRQLPDPLILVDSDDVLTRVREHTDDCVLVAVPSQTAGWRSAGPIDDSCPTDACYYIATSGSTGTPKLVEVPHERTLPFIDWAVDFYGIDRSTRWAQFSSVGFDLALADFLSVVCGGGMLVSLSSQMDRIRPARTVARCRITHWHSVPSMIPYFLRDPDPATASTCRVFSFCGEPLMRTDAESLAERYQHARIINTYGPTETTLFCSFYEYSPAEPAPAEPSLPIGQPIPTWNFVLVPDEGALRLIILSDNVARGYAGVRSAQFSTVDLFGRPMSAFDTGDYFRRAGPHLYFSHRRDGLVKVQGNRVDVGEIEAAAKRSGLVNPVAVVVGDAIALAAEGDRQPEGEVIDELSRYLPRWALPRTVVFVPTHPRTVNGKLDRRAVLETMEKQRDR